MHRTILASLLAVALLAGVATAQGVLRVGSNTEYAPFEYVDEATGELVGFDVDLIREVAKRLGREAEIVSVAWEDIVPGLLAGHYDVVISAMTITDERAQVVDFSDPYFATGQVIVVRADDDTVRQPADLAGKVVAVQTGTTGQAAAERIPGVARIDRYPEMPEAFQALRLGRADAAVADELAALEEVRANPGELKVSGTPFTVEYYGMAVRKGNEPLLRDINRALAQIKADGTYDELYAKWFSSGR